MHLKEALLHKINTKTKPVGALGVLEQLALQAGLVQQTLTPAIQLPHIVVFAGDHGIAADGKVNPYPQAVTAQMVLNFVAGGAAINVFCKQHQIGLTVVDAGVNANFNASLPILHRKIRKGTYDYSMMPAMQQEEACAAMEAGAAIVKNLHLQGCNTLGLGEMGIGNSAAAALLMHHFTGIEVAQCTGRGTGADDRLLQQKIQVLTAAAQLHGLGHATVTPLAALAKVGGFEIAMMCGAYTEAARLGMLIVADGFISCAALLAAKALNQNNSNTPLFENWGIVYAHCSNENGHAALLQHLSAKPVMQLGMRLGEGTGAALAIPLLQSAVSFLNEMASFDSAGVSSIT